ncbi:MAG: hypothetical protein IJG68_01770 [Bacilli bacterium]|nr:hypothetical protein [Bacilli bacterium]
MEELNQYICYLDDSDKKMIDERVAEKGIENYLSQQLIYLDCSRIINGMRMMQTIGYPYQREITSYLYALQTKAGNDFDFDKEWFDKLIKQHHANIEYEKINPPVWYGGKKAKDKWLKDNNKLPRRRKVKEQFLSGMGKEISNVERLKRLSAEFGNLTFKLNPTKKYE